MSTIKFLAERGDSALSLIPLNIGNACRLNGEVCMAPPVAPEPD